MRPDLRRRAAAAIALALVAVGAIGATVVRADDDPALPPVKADELLASTLEASSRPFTVSGEVSTTVDLGVPELPDLLAGAAAGEASDLALLMGDQRWRVWRSPDGLRVAHLLMAREQDLVVSRDEAWWWDSADTSATRLDPAWGRRLLASSLPPRDGGPPGFEWGVPMDLARALIEDLAPCASVSVQGTTSVSGRDAYVLALIPLAANSLVGSVGVTVDAATRLPLRVEVLPKGGGDSPIAVGFTSVSFDPVDPSTFAFVPPPGATVRDAVEMPVAAEAPDGRDLPTVTDVRVIGECLGVVVAARLDVPLPDAASQLLPFAGPLGSAIVVDRGDHAWLLAGPVDGDTLEARAAELP